MTRIYFKGKEDNRFIRKCEALGADYFEEYYCVWKMPKKEGSNRIAIAVTINGYWELGVINENCDNFEASSISGANWKEAEWVIETLNKLKVLIK